LCWHQFFRHTFVVFGARLGGRSLDYLARLWVHSQYQWSSIIHHISLWEVGYGSEFSTIWGFLPFNGPRDRHGKRIQASTGIPVRRTGIFRLVMDHVTGACVGHLDDGWVCSTGNTGERIFPNRLRQEKHSLMPSFLYRIREDSVKWRSRKGETHITDGHI